MLRLTVILDVIDINILYFNEINIGEETGFF